VSQPGSKAASLARIVVDTNILVAAMYRPASDSARVVTACRAGSALAVVSPALIAEYRHILPRAVRTPINVAEWLDSFLSHAVEVHPEAVPPVVSADPADDILFATALAGNASAIVTNDRPVLQVRLHAAVSVLRPREMADQLDPPPPQEDRPCAQPPAAKP
jgi:putative PIN family toxin of toxin-antitoxin system